MADVRRIYHSVDMWEEMQFNMWGSVPDKSAALEQAIEFTGNHKLYGSYMDRVVAEWKFSCENALTDRSINRRAWLGHAACALAIQVPENIIREAWGHLSEEQRVLANNEASRAIAYWESNRQNQQVSDDVEEQMLLRWDT
jgi:hypothetical protein